MLELALYVIVPVFISFIYLSFKHFLVKRKLSGLFFTLLIISSILWVYGLYFFTTSNEKVIVNLSSRLLWTAAPLLIGNLFLFVYSYRSEDLKGIYKIKKATILINLLISISLSLVSIFTNYVVSDADLLLRKIYYGPIYYVIVTYILVNTFFVFRVINSHREKAEGIVQTSVKVIYWGVVITLLSALITNVLTPLIVGNSSYSYLGIFTSIPINIAIAYSMIKHQLFDTRILFGRITYFLVLGIFVLTFFYISYFIEVFSYGTPLKLEAVLIGLPIAVVFIIAFNSFNRFIREKIDSTLISPDYDPKEVISQFNSKVSTVLDYKDIAQTTIDTLAKTIRASFEALVILNPDKDVEIIKGKKEVDVEEAEFSKALEVWQQIGKNPIILDEIEIEMPSIFKQFEDNIEYIVAVMKTRGLKILLPMGRENEIIGILIMGKKEGDSPYNSIELDFLRSITDLTGLALTRAFLYDEVQEFNRTLQHKVDVATTEIADKNRKLEATLKYERDMLDIMGHELRTPLATARNSLVFIDSITKKGSFKPEDFQRYLNISLENIRREIQLVETILASTKIDNDKLDLKQEKVEANDVVQDSFIAYQEAAAKKDLKISTKLPKETLFCLSDRVRIQQVLDNLVSNSIKYTEQGSIEIGLELLDNMVKFYVKDTGEGIPAKEIPNLGKKFYRINNYLQSNGKLGSRQIVRPGGTGIGLYVVFQLVKAMKGKVKVESVVGKGSTFSFTVPSWKESDVSVLPDKSGLN